MLVSVIIPCYNSERYISECIESVLNQSYHNIEIICVDNNSSDSTFKILKQMGKKHFAKIKVFKEMEKGASAARNKGLMEAKGVWIQFLDSDDILLSEKIKTQVALVQNQKADLVVSNYIYEKSAKFEKIETVKNVWVGLIKGRLGITSANLWKRDKLISVGMWDLIKSSQEPSLMFKLLKAGAFFVFDESYNTIVKNRNPSSISNTNLKDNWKRYIELRINIWNYLIKENKINSEIVNVLKSSVFDSIRILHRYDKAGAYDFYRKYVKSVYAPISSRATSSTYMVIYKLLGFNLAQKISYLLSKVK